MGAPFLQEDAGDRDLPCRVAPLQSSTAFLPAYVVDQHPYSCTNLVGHGSHAWKTSGARCRRINPFFRCVGQLKDPEDLTAVVDRYPSDMQPSLLEIIVRKMVSSTEASE